MAPSSTKSMLGVIFLCFSIFDPAAAVPPNSAKAFFGFIDQSCNSRLAALDSAVQDMFLMATSAVSELQTITNNNGSTERTLDAWLPSDGLEPGETRQQWAKFLADERFSKIANLGATKISIYCDGSAVKKVSTVQEGPDKGATFPNGEQAFTIPPERRGKGVGVVHWRANRPDACSSASGGILQGFTTQGVPNIFICPPAFAKQPFRTMKQARGVQQPTDKDIEDYSSAGTTLFHEVTHGILGSKDHAYQPDLCLDLAIDKRELASQNADSLMFYGMAAVMNKNEWSDGFADPLEGSTLGVPKAARALSKALPKAAPKPAAKAQPAAPVAAPPKATPAKKPVVAATLTKAKPSGSKVASSKVTNNASATSKQKTVQITLSDFEDPPRTAVRRAEAVREKAEEPFLATVYGTSESAAAPTAKAAAPAGGVAAQPSKRHVPAVAMPTTLIGQVRKY